MNNFDVIRQDGRLLYEYIRGSHLYGLNNEDSDIDTSGVYVCTRDELFGCFGYKPQVTDSRHDNTWYEIGELVRLLLKSNPTVLESLFVPEDKVIGDIHPIMQMVIDQRDQFISKQCFNPFFGYAKSQIEKARGLNKKIVNPVTERLTPYDFIYTFKARSSATGSATAACIRSSAVLSTCPTCTTSMGCIMTLGLTPPLVRTGEKTDGSCLSAKNIMEKRKGSLSSKGCRRWCP